MVWVWGIENPAVGTTHSSVWQAAHFNDQKNLMGVFYGILDVQPSSQATTAFRSPPAAVASNTTQLLL
jgi:hypothetical protein